jgi:PAS domain S-box-containing protein
MGRQISNHKRRLEKEDEETIREEYVQKMRDNYPLIIRTLMHDIIVSIDKDGNFVFVNDAAVEFLGKSSEKLIGANFTEYLHPEDIGKAMGILQELMGGKDIAKGFVIRVKTPQGFRTLAMNGIAVFDDEGNYIGAHATGRDLTDLLHTEEELEQSRNQFRRLFEVIVDPIVIVDMNGKILEFSQSAEEILGFPREELVGKRFLETKVAKADTEAVMINNLERIKKGMYIPPYAIETVTKDGKKLFYEVNPARIIYKGEPAILAIFRNLTEQKKAEKKLQESEARFNRFLENAPEAIWVQDFVGTFLDGNKRAEELTGYKREELIGKNMLEILVPPESIPRLLEAFKPNKHGGISGPTEVEMIRKDGSLVPVEASTIPIGRDGKIEIIGIARDITERKKAEEALKENEQRFRELSDLLPEVVFETDVTGRITFVNQVAFERFGYTMEDFDKGLNAFQMLIPEDRDRAKDGIDRVLSGADIGFTEYTALKKDGSTFPIMIHSTPIIRGNMPVGLRGIIVDIIERKKMENALKESEEKYRAVFEGATDGIAALDPKTMKVIFTNPKMTEITGYPLDELLNATIIDFVPKNELSSVIQQFQNHTKGKRDLTRYIPVIRKDKTRIYCDVRSKFLNIGNQQYLMAFVRDVTEQKKAEEALKESEERFRSTLDTMLEGCQIVDYNWRYLYVNDAGARHARLAKKDLLGKTIMETQPGIEKTELFSVLRRCMNERVHTHMEYEYMYPNGEKNWFELSIEPMPDGIFVLSIDINDRKRAEKELVRLSSAVRMSNDSIVITDLTGTILDVNEAAMKMYDANDKRDLIGKNSLDLIAPEEREKALADTKMVIEKGYLPSHEYIVTTKDGNKIPVETSTAVMKDANAEPVGFVTISRDITERKKAEGALRSSEEAARRLLEFQNKIIDTATVWVNLIDLKGNVILWNRAAELVSGYSRKEIIGNNKMWKLLYPDPDYRAKIFSIGKEITKEGKRIEDFHSTIRCNDGSLKTISWYATNIADEKGEPAGSLSIGIDVTEREKARQAINNALSLLKQSNKELENYTYVVSHDLKAPLRTIRSFGSFLLEDYGDKLDETGKDYLNRMINASSHLDAMIEDLLVLSRVGRKFTEREKVDLNKLLKEILADLEATIKERNAKVVVDKLPTLYVHRVWERQLFTNLISNALKFNESKTPKIEVLYEERENDHLFKVRDNGIGIEKKYLPRIFNLFERAPTEKKYEGTGAGLAICKKIVEHFGGKIWVESKPGKGSTFIFTIPKEKVKQTKEA